MNILTTLRSGTKTKPVEAESGPRPSKGIEIKSKRELEIMRESARIVATVLKEISQIIAPGLTTLDLDAHAEKRIREMGAVPSFKGYHKFPATLCVSVNNEVVHGIPNAKKIIKAGDVVKVDVGAFQGGFHGDSCITLTVPPVTDRVAKLVKVAEEALYRGIAQVKAGNYLLDIAGAIEDYVKSNGYTVVEDFTGHGVGRNLHEEPSVFNNRSAITGRNPLRNEKLRAGMTLAIEPIINEGSNRVRILADKWTAVTVDNKLSAQFEHTVLVTENGYEIFTDRNKI